MTHGRAVALMLLATLMWSIAGVVTRWLDGTAGFEMTFWRSAANALALVVLLSWLRGPARLWGSLRAGGRALWLSVGLLAGLVPAAEQRKAVNFVLGEGVASLDAYRDPETQQMQQRYIGARQR